MAAKAIARPLLSLEHGASEKESDLGACDSQPSLTLADPFFVFAVLKFLPIREQVSTIHTISLDFYATLRVHDTGSPYWRELCRNLCAQRLLWVPPCTHDSTVLASGRGGWQTLFKELWPLRNRFTREAGGVTTQHLATFRLMSYCRFRGGSQAASSAPTQQGTAVALPLHQRVKMLQQSRPDMSRKEALRRVLAASRAQTCSGNDKEGAAPSDGFSASVLAVHSGAGGSVLTVSPGCGLRNFEFGHVFDGNAKQETVYEQSGLPLVTDFANGVSGALILYGQTGSGKTYTMFGPASPDADAETNGMASRVGTAVLGAAAERRASGLDVSLSVSYLEVFGNDVSDLLADAPEASNYTAARTHLDAGDFDKLIEGQQDLDDALALGESRKRSASTAMNERSTRAHTLLIFHFMQSVSGSDEPPISSRLFLADLGGSERVTKSLANAQASSAGFVPWAEYYNSRRRITETNYINQGLLSLKQCIQALGERQKCSAGRPAPVVPFRDSGLTAVLEPALGGLARTTIIVCCSPESGSAEETVQSLRFGETCSHIKQVQKSTSDPSSAIKKALQQIDEKVAEVERQIREKERWEWRQTVRTDMVDASGTSTWGKSWAHAQGLVAKGEDMETIIEDAVVESRTDAPAETLPELTEVELTEVEHKVWGQVLVGAEEEHEQLEALLEDRRRLLGAN